MCSEVGSACIVSSRKELGHPLRNKGKEKKRNTAVVVANPNFVSEAAA